MFEPEDFHISVDSMPSVQQQFRDVSGHVELLERKLQDYQNLFESRFDFISAKIEGLCFTEAMVVSGQENQLHDAPVQESDESNPSYSLSSKGTGGESVGDMCTAAPSRSSFPSCTRQLFAEEKNIASPEAKDPMESLSQAIASIKTQLKSLSPAKPSLPEELSDVASSSSDGSSPAVKHSTDLESEPGRGDIGKSKKSSANLKLHDEVHTPRTLAHVEAQQVFAAEDKFIKEVQDRIVALSLMASVDCDDERDANSEAAAIELILFERGPEFHIEASRLLKELRSVVLAKHKASTERVKRLYGI